MNEPITNPPVAAEESDDLAMGRAIAEHLLSAQPTNHNRRQWDAIAKSKISRPYQIGLRLMCHGLAGKTAARLASHATDHTVHAKLLTRHANSYKITRGERTSLADQQATIADLANRELISRLVDKAEDMSAKELSVVAGIATDKLEKAEGWTSGNAARAEGLVTEFIRTIREQGMKAELTVEPADPSSQAIDITPTKEIPT